MILIQIVLVIVLLAMGSNFLGSRNSNRTKAVKKLVVLLIIPCAIFVVLFPSTSTDLAHLLGVGRGADLLLYGLIVIVIFQFFDNYIKLQEDQKKLATLSRRLAILEAKIKPNNVKK